MLIGDDFVVRGGKVIIDPSKHLGQDKSLHTWKKNIKESPIEGKKQVEAVIKNTYRTLLSRGMKGCFIYCTDKETTEYFKSLMNL